MNIIRGSFSLPIVLILEKVFIMQATNQKVFRVNHYIGRTNQLGIDAGKRLINLTWLVVRSLPGNRTRLNLSFWWLMALPGQISKGACEDRGTS